MAYVLPTVTVNIFLMLCFHKHEWVRRWSRYIHYGYSTPQPFLGMRCAHT
jgi:hypothetical protein